MSTVSRLVLMFALLLAVLGVVAPWGLQEAVKPVVAWWDLPQACQEFWLAREETARLDRKQAVLEERRRIKARIARQVIQGQLTLREAAAQFLELEDPLPECLGNVPWGPGCTREERACRQVIGWVRGAQNRGSDSAVPALIQRLEQELQDREEVILPRQRGSSRRTGFPARPDGLGSPSYVTNLFAGVIEER